MSRHCNQKIPIEGKHRSIVLTQVAAKRFLKVDEQAFPRSNPSPKDIL
jgi:hypothetical protein